VADTPDPKPTDRFFDDIAEVDPGPPMPTTKGGAAVVAVNVPADMTDDEVDALADEFIKGMLHRADQVK